MRRRRNPLDDQEIWLPTRWQEFGLVLAFIAVIIAIIFAVAIN